MNKLFDLIYQLPSTKDQIKQYHILQKRIQQIIVQLIHQSKINTQEIQKVCKNNAKLNIVARLLRQHLPPQGIKDNVFSITISSIISMFTFMMVTPKMIQYLNKLSIPFSIYRIILRMYCSCGKFEFFKKMQVEQCFKFIAKKLSVKSKNFPRLYVSLILNILNEYSQKVAQKQKRQPGQDLIINKQNQRILQCIKIIANTALQLIKNNLKLAAQSGILVAMYSKAIQNDLNATMTQHLIQTISHHMKNRDNRQIILAHLDLCKVFAIFTNIDSSFKDGKPQDKVQRCAIIIQMLLSQWSTLCYFVSQRATLRNFILSLGSKSKSKKQMSIINDKIFLKLIDKAMRYDRNKMLRSNNTFGLSSNYLNYNSLLILSFFLQSTQIFDSSLSYNPKGNLFPGLDQASLMYFPGIFQKGKYTKQIIQVIKVPTISQSEKLSRNFLDILSYYNYSMISYDFSSNQLVDYLLQIKEMKCYQEQFPQQNRTSIENLLKKIKQSHHQNFNELLLNFYSQTMKICEILPWMTEHLKLSKFLSAIVNHLRNKNYNPIIDACLDVVTKIFNNPKPNYQRFLYITALDDAGKYFQNHKRVQELIQSHYRNQQYSFRISRILLHAADVGRRQLIEQQSYQKIIQSIFNEGGCQDLILQAIQIIRFYCIDNDDKADWGTQIICQKLLYHPSQQIVSAATQFCEQFVINHKSLKNYLYKTNLQLIRNNNLRKRIMYLLLNSDKGMQILHAYNQNFIKDQLDLWLKQNLNLIKQLSSFLAKQSKKSTGNRQSSFLNVGKTSQNIHKLIFLPWNVLVNGKHYIGLASYKYLKQKIKLRISLKLLVQSKIQLSSFVQIGEFKVAYSQSKNTIIVKKEQIMKNYERNKFKDNRELKQFAVSKQKITFTFKYNAGCLILQKIHMDIPLARDGYRSLTYPLNFIALLTKTSKGFGYLRQHKFIQHCIEFCKQREERQEKESDVQIIKGAIESLGMLFSSQKLELPILQKIQVYAIVMDIFEKTTNFQIKEVALWTLNILVKDEDLRKKIKQNKGWLILQSKYCGWLCYPQFANKFQFGNNQLGRIHFLLPQKLNHKGYELILSVLQLCDKSDKQIHHQKQKQQKMIQFFKNPQHKAQAWDPKLLERVVMYVSTINFGLQRTKKVLDMFTDYFLSEKFDTDFIYGSSLP